MPYYEVIYFFSFLSLTLKCKLPEIVLFVLSSLLCPLPLDSFLTLGRYLMTSCQINEY